MEDGELFNAVLRHVDRQNVAITLRPGKPISPAALVKAESKMKINLPPDLQMLYRNIGNGFSIYWIADNQRTKPFGSLEIPALSKLAEIYHKSYRRPIRHGGPG